MELSAYAPLITSTIVDTIYIPVEDIFILEDPNSTFWTTKPDISGVGINSETASKFISFENKNADTDDFYATVLLLNYGLNPYIDNANPALGEYTEDVIIYGNARITNSAYINGNLVVNGTILIAKIQELESRIAKLEANL